MNDAFLSNAITTLEKQFELNSKMTGLIAASNDIMGLIVLPFVSFFGDNRHRPRWLGIGSLVSVLGGLFFILPQLIVGTSQVNTGSGSGM